jgi:hypothetical protein
MADQASLKAGKPNPRAEGNGTPESQVVGGIAGFGTDIATLAELQTRLALLDLKASVQKAALSLGLFAAALIGLTGALPVALAGVAVLLAGALRISLAWSLLLTGGVVLAAALATLVVSASKIGPSFTTFRRSHEELTRNLAWIRTVLLYSGRPVPRRCQ